MTERPPLAQSARHLRPVGEGKGRPSTILAPAYALAPEHLAPHADPAKAAAQLVSVPGMQEHIGALTCTFTATRPLLAAKLAAPRARLTVSGPHARPAAATTDLTPWPPVVYGSGIGCVNAAPQQRNRRSCSGWAVCGEKSQTKTLGTPLSGFPNRFIAHLTESN